MTDDCIVGSTMNFSLQRRFKGGRLNGIVDGPRMNHICQVNVLEKVDARNERLDPNIPLFGTVAVQYYICRRIDNGHPIFAFERELTPIER